MDYIDSIEIQGTGPTLSIPDFQNDPDPEVILTCMITINIAVAAAFIPLVSQLSLKAAEDQQDTHILLDQFKTSLDQANATIDFLIPILRDARLWNEQIWPVGFHGIVLQNDIRNLYLQHIQEITTKIKEIDEASIKLASKGRLKGDCSWLNHEIGILQTLIDMVIKARTYGFRITYLRHCIKQSQSIIKEASKIFSS